MALNELKRIDVFIDKIDEVYFPKIEAAEGEYKGRYLTAQLTNGGLVGSQTATLNLGWKHRTAKNSNGESLQGLDAFSVLDKAKGIYQIKFATNMMVKGIVDATIQIIENGEITNINGLRINVTETAYDDNAAESSNSFTALQAALSQVSKPNPRGIFDTLAQLQAAYPNGDTGTYLVKDPSTNISKSYMWQDGNWVFASDYQGIEVEDGSITNEKIAFGTIKKDNLDENITKVLPQQVLDDDEVVFSITDNQNNRSFLEINKNGYPTDNSKKILKDVLLDGITSPQDAGFNEEISFVITDASNKISDLEINSEGHISDRVFSMWKSRLEISSEAFTKSDISIIKCFGDSLTEGGSPGTPYPSRIKSYIKNQNVEVQNFGVSGQTAGAIAFRMGANQITLKSVSGNTISGDSTVETACVLETSLGSPSNLKNSTIECLVNGVACIVTSTASASSPNSGKIRLKTTGSALTVSSPIVLKMNPSVSKNDVDPESNEYLHIFWVGKNDSWFARDGFFVEQVPEIVKGMVDYLNAQQKRFLVLSVTNSTNEIIGHERYTTINQVNAELKRMYPNNYVDVRSYLVKQAIYDAGITPTADDLNQMKNDAPPKSIMNDDTHYNDAGREQVSKFIFKQLKSRGWIAL